MHEHGLNDNRTCKNCPWSTSHPDFWIYAESWYFSITLITASIWFDCLASSNAFWNAARSAPTKVCIDIAMTANRWQYKWKLTDFPCLKRGYSLAMQTQKVLTNNVVLPVQRRLGDNWEYLCQGTCCFPLAFFLKRVVNCLPMQWTSRRLAKMPNIYRHQFQRHRKW